MKLNRTTISLLILSLGLTSVVYITEIKPEGFNLNPKNQKEEEIPKIFSFKTQDLEKINIKAEQTIITFQKQRKGEENSFWQMTQPENLLANEGAIAFLVNLFPPAEKKLTIPANDENRKKYGLWESQKKIELTLSNGDQYEITLGSANFDNTQIYVEVKFPTTVEDQSSIFLVSKSFQYAIERDFDEWKQNELGNK
jgi:hypothetical protein